MNKLQPHLTIGMAACRNLDQVKFTVTALRMYHPEVMHKVEIVICDNAPEDLQGQAMSRYADGWLHGVGRYVDAGQTRGTSYPRDLLFREARGEWTFCIDSHVMLPPGTLARLIEWTKQNPDCRDLIQGPMMLDDLGETNMATGMQPTWGEGMRGQWITDPDLLPVDAPAKEIELHGLGLFGCRTDAWPGFNPRFAGFGGEEGYIHEKFRQRGNKAICLPFLRWWHLFRDREVTPPPYSHLLVLQLRNNLIAFDELGWDRSEVLQEFAGKLNPEETRQIQMEFGRTMQEWTALGVLSNQPPTLTQPNPVK